MAWGTKQPAYVRWPAVLALLVVPLAIRELAGRLYGGVPALTFYPVILVVALVFGWIEASVALVVSLLAGLFFFLPPGMYLVPVGWVFVGGLGIAIIAALKTLAARLASANERQRLLFRELQHRVANTLQSAVAIMDAASRQVPRSPNAAMATLDEGGRRLLASAEVHRRLYDPTLLDKDLESILREAVATIVDGETVDVRLRIEPVNLTFDQLSAVTMLVIELANNAQKHVFERKLGSNFAVTLARSPGGRAILSVTDDGPGLHAPETTDGHGTLGQSIIVSLASQLTGILSMDSDQGMKVNVTFPILVP
jgi:two-component sensor histidine kinase